MKNETAIDVFNNPLFWKYILIFGVCILLLVTIGR